MASSLWWFLDALVASIVIISAYYGAKKGFLGTLVSTIGCIAAMALAVAVSSPLSNSIYDSMLRDNIRQKAVDAISSYAATEEISIALTSNYEDVTISSDDVSKALSDSENISENINILLCSGTGQKLTSEETDELLQDAFETTFGNKIEEKLPSFCMQKLREKTQSDPEMMTEAVFAVVSKNPDSACEFIETTYIKPVVISVLKTGLTILIFCIAAAIINLAANFLLEAIIPTPVKAVDKFAGLIIGAGLGIVVAIVIGMGTDVLITLSDGDLIFLNESTIEKTKLFKYILL